VDVNSWNFSIKGMVENPLRLSYADIRKLPSIDQMLTLECISNPPDGTAISNAVWTGVKLRPLLERARVKRGAKFVAMRGADGYHTVLPLDELMREENFLPYLMNGDPLPAEHGYPLRIFIPGKYGMKQPKWITEIEFADHEIPGYWETRGWSHSAWRKVNSGLFAPRVEAQLSGRKFLGLYFSSGIAGGLLSWIFTPFVGIVPATNRSDRSLALQASPRHGPTPKISCMVSRSEEWL